MRIGVAAAMFLIGLGATEARAGVRAGLSLGAWSGTFTQEGFGLKMSQKGDINYGFQLFVGGKPEYVPVFVEAAVIFLPGHDTGTYSRNADYYSWLSLSVGASLPYIPIEPYVGIERASYAFGSGVAETYDGISVRAGANLVLSRDPAAFGLRAEYRRAFIAGDSQGDLPEDYTTRADVFFVGLFFGIMK